MPTFQRSTFNHVLPLSDAQDRGRLRRPWLRQPGSRVAFLLGQRREATPSTARRLCTILRPRSGSRAQRDFGGGQPRPERQRGQPHFLTVGSTNKIGTSINALSYSDTSKLLQCFIFPIKPLYTGFCIDELVHWMEARL